MNIETYMQTLGAAAKKAGKQIAKASTDQKNQALQNIANILIEQQDKIITENAKDLSAGKKNGLDDALLDRLMLDKYRIIAMAEGVSQIAKLPDPIGAISDLKYQASGIQVGKMRVPLGVVGMIYESRPNVTVDAGVLCLKSGNSVILRGGSEAKFSNHSIAQCIHSGLIESGLPKEIVQVVEPTDRAAVNQLITMNEFVDVIIPRGGKGLVSLIAEHAKVPVIKHLDGICHIYLDEFADKQKAINIAINAKTHRYGVCNAMETLLINNKIAQDLLPDLTKQYQDLGVELRGCAKTCAIAKDIKLADEADWATEYLAPILSIKIVADINEAINHIEQYSSGHTEAIVTENYTLARQFLTEVDSSSVMINTSTRFADGFEYGLGAEIGISTDKIHVRGPVGLEGLTSQKFVVFGDGQVRE